MSRAGERTIVHGGRGARSNPGACAGAVGRRFQCSERGRFLLALAVLAFGPRVADEPLHVSPRVADAIGKVADALDILAKGVEQFTSDAVAILTVS